MGMRFPRCRMKEKRGETQDTLTGEGQRVVLVVALVTHYRDERVEYKRAVKHARYSYCTVLECLTVTSDSSIGALLLIACECA